MKFSIHEDNIERLRNKITRIRNKCMKYGCDFVYEEVGEEFKTFNEGKENEHTERYIVVEAEGTAVVNNWRFAATLEHTDKGNIIHKMIGEVEIPDRYYNCQPACEHCHSQRHRKNTYIVYNEETEEFKQVGSSCLNDFTHGLSAEAVAQYISLFDSLMEFETPPAGSSHKVYYETREILNYAVDFVNNLGYASTQGDYNQSTKSKVIDMWLYKRGRLSGNLDRFEREFIESYLDKYHPDYTSEELVNYIEAMTAHILAKDDDSDYIHNLKVILTSPFISGRSVGYAVSAVQCYRKDVEREAIQREREARAAKEARHSDYIGNVNDRIEVVDPEAIEVITSWYNQFGTTVRYKITDAIGNVIMWDSSTGIDADKEVKMIRGTVKKFDEFNGVKQTWLTRCKVVYC